VNRRAFVTGLGALLVEPLGVEARHANRDCSSEVQQKVKRRSRAAPPFVVGQSETT
jgi:hypothetical protein